MRLKTNQKEITDILKALVVISLAFAIANVEEFSVSNIITVGIFSAVTAGTGFLLHELAHKVVAQNYGYWAEFRSFDNFFPITILLSFLGVIFAAPGAVFIHGNVTRTENGRISIAGPIVNVVFTIIFLQLYLAHFPILETLGIYGAMINGWLAIFNMIPVWNLDGAKVFIWNKVVYSITLAAAILLFAATFLVR